MTLYIYILFYIFCSEQVMLEVLNTILTLIKLDFSCHNYEKHLIKIQVNEK